MEDIKAEIHSTWSLEQHTDRGCNTYRMVNALRSMSTPDTYEFEVPQQWIIHWNEANDYQHDGDTDVDYSDYYDYEIDNS